MARNETKRFRCSLDEADRIHFAAGRVGETFSEFVRQAALERALHTEVSRAPSPLDEVVEAEKEKIERERELLGGSIQVRRTFNPDFKR